MGKKILKVIRNIFIVILLIIVLFFTINIVYLGLTFKRIPDKQNLEINYSKVQDTPKSTFLRDGVSYKAISYNIGFSAYTPQFSFFMDGGSESWAFSEDSVKKVTNDIADVLISQDADFISLQEVDSNSTRTYHVDETQIIKDKMINYSDVDACCYDSAFLFWPPWQPHGKSVSNLMTLSKYNPTSSIRRQFPIDEGPTAILDYDRCYSITRYETENGKELVWYTTHMSAYSKDATTSNKQIEMLIKDMQHEFELGNYVICGADFNKQIVENPQNYFPENIVKSTNPFPIEYLKDTKIQLVSPFNIENPVGTCRDAGEPLNANSPVSNIDGFLVSPNIKILSADVINTGFEFSDHNPVYITFRLL